MNPLYPANPVNVPPGATSASPNFKREVKKVLFAIFLFFAVYIVLVALAIWLAVLCVYGGFAVIIHSGHFLGIVAGLGIISIGVMVCFFLIKFIFSVKKYDDAGTLEVKEEEQPTLFAFIKQLTIDTQNPFPKKIVLAPEVNAAVYYNDSFWSMLFPVKKNLKIGLGLVNSLTLSEFKAVMAHEFGHFSQRSMKLGSFVYNVNKVIYNMLYENKSYGSALETLSSLHFVIYIFAWITIQIVTGIQYLLKHMYGFINKSYMGLSREMEFHADAVAASVSGSQSCISALQKLEITDLCYQTVINKANYYLQEKKQISNAYECQNVVMETYAIDNELPLQNNVPVADETFFTKFQLSKINIKDQWASHPSREERSEKLNELNIEAQENNESAWLLFNNPAQLQQQLTKMLYVTVGPEQIKEELNTGAFKEEYNAEAKKFTLPNEYNGFYDDRQMPVIDVEQLAKAHDASVVSNESFSTLFGDTQIALAKSLMGNEQDVAILQAITSKQIDTKTFDYDGEKRSKKEAEELCKKIELEVEEQKRKINSHEEKVVTFFYAHALKKGEVEASALLKQYQQHFENRKRIEDFLTLANNVAQILQPLAQGQKIEFAAAENIATDLQDETIKVKGFLKDWLSKGVFDSNATLKSQVESFIPANYRYFSRPSFFDFEINALHNIIQDTINSTGAYQFLSFKEILETQIKLANN